mmetsp:Transcript_38146/g.80286  ORF Transcript_38146/g.80286 Transcript_38146/m.80286 type:complete len:121 (-) Transcript_38146:120-482(-)
MNTPSELQRIQNECASMVQTLQSLHEEERQLREANQLLAQRAVLMGCTGGLDGGTRRGARRKAAAKKQANNNATSTSTAGTNAAASNATATAGGSTPKPSSVGSSTSAKIAVETSMDLSV